MKKKNGPPLTSGEDHPPAQADAFDGVPTPKNIAAWSFAEPAFDPVGDWGIVTLVFSKSRKGVLEPLTSETPDKRFPLLGGEADAAYREIAQQGNDNLLAILASPHNAPVLAMLAEAGSKIVHLLFEVSEIFTWKKSAPNSDIKKQMLATWFSVQSHAKHFIKNNGV